VKAKILIYAPQKTVWETVRDERKNDPDLAYCRVLEQTRNESKLEEKFVFIPVCGSVTCVLRTTEVPLQRIDYELLKSDHFKVLEGSWVLTPESDGKATMLELSSSLDIGVPFSRSCVESYLAKKLGKRVQYIKMLAEAASQPPLVAGLP
jgi:hypothetical protein